MNQNLTETQKAREARTRNFEKRRRCDEALLAKSTLGSDRVMKGRIKVGPTHANFRTIHPRLDDPSM